MRAVPATLLAVASLVAGVAPSRAETAEKGSFGLGFIVGEPTGVVAKLYLSDDTALQAAAGTAFVSDGLQAHLDFLWHPWILTDHDTFTLPAYVGPGARLFQYDQGRDGDDYFAVGVRGVAGILFDFKNIPLDTFVEVAVIGEYALGSDDDNGFGFSLNAGAGVRYYF